MIDSRATRGKGEGGCAWEEGGRVSLGGGVAVVWGEGRGINHGAGVGERGSGIGSGEEGHAARPAGSGIEGTGGIAI